MNLKARSRTVTRLQLCGILLFYLMVDIRMQSTQLQIQCPKTSLTDCVEIHGAFNSSLFTRFYIICVKSIADRGTAQIPTWDGPRLTATRVAPWPIATGRDRTIKGGKFSWSMWLWGKCRVILQQPACMSIQWGRHTSPMCGTCSKNLSWLFLERKNTHTLTHTDNLISIHFVLPHHSLRWYI